MIQIDMPMPKSCKACRFLLFPMVDPLCNQFILCKQFMYRCAVTGYYIGDDDKTRDPSCPLLKKEDKE